MEEEAARLDAAVECTRVQQEEARIDLANAEKALLEEEAVSEVLSQSVPSFVLKEDVPAYVAKRATLTQKISSLHALITDCESILRDNKNALVTEVGTVSVLEAARAAGANHGDAMVKARERLSQQMGREMAQLQHTNGEKEKLEVRLRTVKANAEAAEKVLASRRAELKRAKDALVAAGEGVAAAKAKLANAQREAIYDTAQVKSQEAWLEQLKAENLRLKKALLAAAGGGGGTVAADSVPLSSSTHFSQNPQHHLNPQNAPPSVADALSYATHLSSVSSSVPIMDQFRGLNQELLQQVQQSVKMLEKEYNRQTL